MASVTNKLGDGVGLVDKKRDGEAGLSPAVMKRETSVPQYTGPGSLDIILNNEIRGWAWSPNFPTQAARVLIQVDGKRLAVVSAQSFRADLAAAGIGHGCYAFAYRIPDELQDGNVHEVRVFNSDSFIELDGSPLSLEIAATTGRYEDTSTSPFANARFDLWPSGLSGSVSGQCVELAPDLYVSFGGSVPGSADYAVTAPRYFREEEKPRYGVKITKDRATDCSLVIGLSGGASAMLHAGLLFTVEMSLAQADEAQAQRPATFNLMQFSKGEFVAARRLARARVFRTATLLTVWLKLSPEEVRLAQAHALGIGVSVQNCGGWIVQAPNLHRRHVIPPGGFHGHEDERLTKAFAACRELALVNNALPIYQRLMDVTMPTKEPRPWGENLPNVADRSSGNEQIVEQTPDQEQDVYARRAGIRSNTDQTPHILQAVYPFTQIIIPAYNGDNVVVECLASIQRNTFMPFQCIVVNDGSREYSTDMLRAFAESDPRFIVFDRSDNRGYTKSVNEGIKLTNAEWLVVLNSDTVVSRDWLLRLHDATAKGPKVGMVGPLSNAASYQSVPRLRDADNSWSKNDFIKPCDIDVVQTMLEDASDRSYPSLPLLNGFCTLISRAVFEVCGFYDEESFPIGYGEENDLCLRALKAGFELVVADDCFVYHRKSVSFRGGRKELSRNGSFELLSKHLGVSLPDVERRMQEEPSLVKIRNRLHDLKSLLGKPLQAVS